MDRIGDTFRWKGENVATSEVEAAIGLYGGIKEVNVYGVAVPGTEGRVGMAMIVPASNLDIARFRDHLVDTLPAYARPMFLRVRCKVDTTATFKYSKNDAAREGYDPLTVPDDLFVYSHELEAFIRVDRTTYDQIKSGRFRL